MDRDEVRVRAGPTHLGVVIVLVIEVGVQLGEEVVVLAGRDVHGRNQSIVGDEQEAVLAFELRGDRLDQGVVAVRVLDPAPDRLDQVEELVGRPLGVAVQENVGVNLLVSLVQFVEEHIGEYTLMPPADRHSAPPDIVVVGAASRDLAATDPRGWRLGGSVTYSALAIARLGLRVGALIGVDPPAAGAGELRELAAAGVDVRLVPLASGPVFDNLEEPGGRRQIAHAASDPVPSTYLPAAWTATGGWLLVPVAGELPESWALIPPDEALVAVGWQGLLRELRAGTEVRRIDPHPTSLLARADLVGVSRDDLAGDVELSVLCRLLRPGATLVVTAGDGGGIVVEAGADGPRRLHRYPALRPDRWIDATGAGDTFLAALFAGRVRPGLVGGRIGQRHDVLLAAAAASLAVEEAGLDGVPARESIRRRIAEAGARTAGRVG